MSRVASVLAAMLVVIASVPFATAGAATTGLDLLTCTLPSTVSLRFNPPATNSPQTETLTVSRQYKPCVSAMHPDITSGHSTDTGTFPDGTCLSPFRTNKITIPITWNNGQTSTLSGENVSSMAGVTLTVDTTGTVTSGVFTGATFKHTVVYPSEKILQCNLGLGTLSDLKGEVNLEIITP
jgi:hypothetical protein